MPICLDKLYYEACKREDDETHEKKVYFSDIGFCLRRECLKILGADRRPRPEILNWKQARRQADGKDFESRLERALKSIGALEGREVRITKRCPPGSGARFDFLVNMDVLCEWMGVELPPEWTSLAIWESKTAHSWQREDDIPKRYDCEQLAGYGLIMEEYDTFLVHATQSAFITLWKVPWPEFADDFKAELSYRIGIYRQVSKAGEKAVPPPLLPIVQRKGKTKFVWRQHWNCSGAYCDFVGVSCFPPQPVDGQNEVEIAVREKVKVLGGGTAEQWKTLGPARNDEAVKAWLFEAIRKDTEWQKTKARMYVPHGFEEVA